MILPYDAASHTCYSHLMFIDFVSKDKTTAIRGFKKEANHCVLGHLYSIIRTSRQPRRSLLQSMLRTFDDHKVDPLFLLLFGTLKFPVEL